MIRYSITRLTDGYMFTYLDKNDHACGHGFLSFNYIKDKFVYKTSGGMSHVLYSDFEKSFSTVKLSLDTAMNLMLK